ncbi:RicAFT regulatory complex protein RicA family protein [Bacillus sp. V3B]|uniref:RicAFT regulatory complex protein RicA family protein n=1 Tax=Bacillus sp. V3B TaxID=2804915 RepID=UPI00210C8C01|nr:RicAFT regulatory complex protein RicA family protein [Bacillus sp. V3B]MCQ6274179.1 RicAFT regulatory complex protein RicA family protein [Bacillus sp. V3B]
MGKYTKDEIVAKAKDLAKMIAETEEVDFFKRAEAHINENKKVSDSISAIKGLQKQAVNFQHYGKVEALRKTEEKIAKLEQELDELPIVYEFKQSQADVNDLLQLVASTISNSVTNEILTATGGNLLSGETGSAINNKNCSHH